MTAHPIKAAAMVAAALALGAAGLVITAAPGVAASRAVSRCLLVVEGRTVFSGPCSYDQFDADGSFTITERHRQPYFGYLLRDGRSGHGYWNGGRRSSHAHDDLGPMRQNGGCWENRRNKICAWN